MMINKLNDDSNRDFGKIRNPWHTRELFKFSLQKNFSRKILYGNLEKLGIMSWVLIFVNSRLLHNIIQIRVFLFNTTKKEFLNEISSPFA